MNIDFILNTVFLGNTLFSYLESLNIFLAAWIIFFLIDKLILDRLKTISVKTVNKIDDLAVKVVAKLGWPFFMIFGLNIAVLALESASWVKSSINIVTILIVASYLVVACREIVSFWIANIIKKDELIAEAQQKSLYHLIGLLAQILIWIVASISILQILQIDVSALVGTLGIGGIAIAFALQSILSDIFASFSIYFDRPFGVGDFIQLGTDSGTVEKIGVKSTRIKTLQGELMIVPNKELTNVRIQNFTHLERRRSKFRFGVEYDTPNNKLKAIPKALAHIIEFEPNCDFSWCILVEIGPYSLIFEVVYYVEEANYSAFLKTQENIYLELKSYLEKHKIALAYPAQEIVIKK